jgi:anti-sigma factor RsiW
MNTDSAETRSAHLDLADLIAEAAGQPASERARAHLARCPQCRTEAGRWNLVAAGVRGLAAATPEAAAPAAAPPARPPHTPPRILAGPRRRMVLASAAAVLILLGGAGYWAASAVTGHAPGAVLTAVSGCTGLELTSGTLQQVSGGQLVIKTASGQRVTVTTTAATRMSVAGPLLRDITDGAPVIALGPSSGGTIAAASVTVGPAPGGKGNGTLRVTPPPGWAVARGTVSDASPAGFTVVTSGGTRIPVTVTGGTNVVVPDARLGQLQPGITTVALGHARSGQALTAIGVLQQPAGSNLQVHFSMAVRGCPHTALADALAAALSRG